jgi:hypothetical protein
MMMLSLSRARTILALVVLGAVVAIASSSEWRLTFEDDFDGDAVNASRWNVADNMRHGGEELQLYMKDEVYVEKGDLVLRTRRRDVVWNETRM